jgi:hypothetical protein
MKAISVTVPLLSSIGLSHKAAIKIDKLNKTDLSDKLKNIVYSRRNFSHEIVFGNTHTRAHTHTHTNKQPSKHFCFRKSNSSDAHYLTVVVPVFHKYSQIATNSALKWKVN